MCILVLFNSRKSSYRVVLYFTLTTTNQLFTAVKVKDLVNVAGVEDLVRDIETLS